MTAAAPASAPVRVCVVDDHRSFADALALAMDGRDDIEYAGGTASPEAAPALVAATRPDVVVMDLSFPDGDGLSLTRRIRRHHPQTRIVIVSGRVGQTELAGALAAGAAGFISKESALEDIIDTVARRPTSGFVVLGPSLDRMLRDVVAGEVPPAHPDAGLTGRERQILRLLSDGRTASGIASELRISVHTCRGHIKSILQKLGAHTQLEAVAIASRAGLVRVPEGP